MKSSPAQFCHAQNFVDKVRLLGSNHYHIGVGDINKRCFVRLRLSLEVYIEGFSILNLIGVQPSMEADLRTVSLQVLERSLQPANIVSEASQGMSASMPQDTTSQKRRAAKAR